MITHPELFELIGERNYQKCLLLDFKSLFDEYIGTKMIITVDLDECLNKIKI